MTAPRALRCPACGSSVDEAATACPTCGANLVGAAAAAGVNGSNGTNGTAGHAPVPPPPTGSVPPMQPPGSPGTAGSVGGPFTLGDPVGERSWGAPTDEPQPSAPAAPTPSPTPPPSYGEQRAGLFDAVPRSSEPEPPLFAADTTPEAPAPPADPELTLAPPPPTATPPGAPAPPPSGGPLGSSLPPNDQDLYPGDPNAPRQAEGRRTPVLIGAVVLALLVVALAAFLLVKWLGDDGDTADGGDPVTASTVASSAPQATAGEERTATEDTTASTTTPPSPAVVAIGVVHLAGDGTSDCAAIGVDRTVRVTADGSSDVETVPLTGGSELGRTGTGAAEQLHCEYRYEVGLPDGPSTFTFSLEAGGSPEDVREVSADEVRSGTGPFLGTVYVPG